MADTWLALTPQTRRVPARDAWASGMYFQVAVPAAPTLEAVNPLATWHGSALDYAGRAYTRECGWDFPPGEGGVWLLRLAPVQGVEGDDTPWSYFGHVTGFVVLSDRDEDGSYEAVGHIWTASRWRRKGIAQRLLTEAKSRFQFTDVEQPYSDDGAAFLRACGYVE